MSSFLFSPRGGFCRLIALIAPVLVISGSAVAQDRLLPLGYSKIPEEMRGNVPLPVGISLNYCYLSEKLRIRDLDISLNGQPVPSELVEMNSINQHTQTETARADIWLLSFLNLYGIGGHVHGSAYNLELDLSPMMQIPLPLPSDFSIDYSGSVYGVGAVIGSGYGPLFLSYDVCYTWTDINKLDSTVRTLVQSIRARYRILEESESKVYVYLGTSNEGIRATQRGSINLDGNRIDFSLKARAETPWNALAGTQVEFSPHWNLCIEGGFMGRRQAAASLGYRF